MSADLIAALWEGLVASSAAALLVLLLRRPWRLTFGSASLPLLWAMVPLALLAMALPAAEVSAPTRMLMLPALDAVAAPVAASPAAASTDPRQIVLLIWLGGCLIAGAWFLHLQLGFRRRLGALRQRGDGLHQASSTAAGPAVLGLLRPRIILPADFETRYSADEQALIISHERSHLRRGDLYANAIATALRCIYWFNPLLHYAAARLRHDHELASDAEVLREYPQARRRYADTLLNVQLAVPGLPVGCLWQSSHPLKDRIMQMKQPLPSRSRHLAGMALAVLALSASAFAAWATQPASTASAAGDNQQEPTYRALKPPKYPQSAAESKLEGKVVLRVVVGSDGLPRDVAVEHASTPGVFDEAAISAVKGWKFNPAMKDGAAVEATVLVPICFATDEQAECPATPNGLDGIYIKPQLIPG